MLLQNKAWVYRKNVFYVNITQQWSFHTSPYQSNRRVSSCNNKSTVDYLLQYFPVSLGGLLDQVPHSPSILARHNYTCLSKIDCHLHHEASGLVLVKRSQRGGRIQNAKFTKQKSNSNPQKGRKKKLQTTAVRATSLKSFLWSSTVKCHCDLAGSTFNQHAVVSSLISVRALQMMLFS